MNIIKTVIPPDNWKRPVAFVLGVFVGLIIFTIYISNAVSYLSDSPQTCINCHIMKPQMATWQHSSHREAAVCNDCHVPQNNFFSKYYFKAADGLRHATVFTLRNEPQVITINDAGTGVVQNNCIRCHEILNSEVDTKISLAQHKTGEGKLCWNCHQDVPHGRVNSLASVSYYIDYQDVNRIPEWLHKALTIND